MLCNPWCFNYILYLWWHYRPLQVKVQIKCRSLAVCLFCRKYACFFFPTPCWPTVNGLHSATSCCPTAWVHHNSQVATWQPWESLWGKGKFIPIPCGKGAELFGQHMPPYKAAQPCTEVGIQRKMLPLAPPLLHPSPPALPRKAASPAQFYKSLHKRFDRNEWDQLPSNTRGPIWRTCLLIAFG